MIGFETSGSFSNTDAFLRRMARGDFYSSLQRFGQQGVDALEAATPKDTGLTAGSWYYEIDVKADSAGQTVTLWWCNRNANGNFNVAVGIQYGHGTRNGGYVEPIDFINPALRPIFDQLADATWKEVRNA